MTNVLTPTDAPVCDRNGRLITLVHLVYRKIVPPLTTVLLTKKLDNNFIYFIHLCTLSLKPGRVFARLKKVNNILTHTKQFPFHAPITTGVYSVCFDLFRYLVRPGF